MNAKETREYATNVGNAENKSKIDILDNAINIAAHRGAMYCDVSESLNEFVLTYFKKQGFTITSHEFGRNDFYYRIQW
jgi:hypothetical protein